MFEDHGRTAEDDERVRRLLNSGAEFLGGSAGGAASVAIGFLVAGPAGAALGGAASVAISMALRRVGADVTDRLLSPREQSRIGFVLAVATEKIHSRIEQGETLRADGFFEPKHGARSDAEEVAESVLLKSQREPEEKKLPYMANLLTHIAFDSTTSVHIAHQLIRSAEQLTYRQLCILGLVSSIDELSLRQSNYDDQRQFTEELGYILYECKDLEDRGLIFIGTFAGQGQINPDVEGYIPGGKNIVRRSRTIGNPNARSPAIPEIVPATMQLQAFGTELCDYMALEGIPREDLEAIARLLQ